MSGSYDYELVKVGAKVTALDGTVRDGETQVATHRWTVKGAEADASKKTAVCVHGLTRNARDFDFLAGELLDSGLYSRVISIDVPGRGQSEHLKHPEDYEYGVYVPVVRAVLGTLGVARLDYIGTSMGGLIGMFIAAGEGDKSEEERIIDQFVMNDIGPFVPATGLDRLLEYVDKSEKEPFANVDAVEAYLRTILEPYGEMPEEDWKHLAKHTAEPIDGGDGKCNLAYDSQIGITLVKKAPFSDIVMWPIWEKVNTRVLVIHGEESDLLSKETCDGMVSRGPSACEVAHIANVGHAPALMTKRDSDIILKFLSPK